MLEEPSSFKKRVEANLSMGCSSFRSHPLLVMFALAKVFSWVNAHEQFLIALGLTVRCGEMVTQVFHLFRAKTNRESLSPWTRGQRFATLSIAETFRQFYRAITAAKIVL